MKDQYCVYEKLQARTDTNLYALMPLRLQHILKGLCPQVQQFIQQL